MYGLVFFARSRMDYVRSIINSDLNIITIDYNNY